MLNRNQMLTYSCCVLLLAGGLGGCPVPELIPSETFDAADNSGRPVGDRDGGSTGNESVGETNDGTAQSPTDLDFTLTGIPVHVQGRIAVGDDLIAFTEDLGDRNRLSYIVPSEKDTAGRALPNAEQWDADSFLVTGTKIILLGGPTNDFVFTLSVFDTETGTLNSISKDDVRLESIPVSNYSPAFMVVDGPYVGTINKIGFDGVADRRRLRVVDVSDAVPSVVVFDHNPGDDEHAVIDMIMVDAETQTLVAQMRQTFYLYDITNPSAAPRAFDTSAFGGVEQFDTQHAYENGIVIYYDNRAQENFWMWDLVGGATAPVMIEKTRLGAGRSAIRGDFYAILANGKATAADLSDTTPVESDPSTRVGSGVSLAIGVIDDEPYAIIGSQDATNTMQFSPGGGAWSTVADPRSPDSDFETGDVQTNTAGGMLAFKYDDGRNYFLGYAALDAK